MLVICVGVAAAAYSVVVACVQAAAHEVWRGRGLQAHAWAGAVAKHLKTLENT